MGTGISGAGEGQQTRGTSEITGTQHCSKLGPMGIRGGKNIIGGIQIWRKGTEQG